MTEEKRNRLAAAATVNITLLIVILVAVIIYQLVVIAATSAQYRQIEQEITQLEQMTKDAEDELDYLQSQENLLRALVERGYHY